MDNLALAEAVRTACVDAAVDAHEDAGVQGLCIEGRWEAAVSAVRRLDLGELLQRFAEDRDTPSS